MTVSEIITAVSIYLLVPAAGLVAYLILRRRLLAKGASSMFLAQLFLLFVCYGGVLLVLLTSLFWQWSGMASLGVFFLLLAAPVLLFPVLLSLWKQKNVSSAHRVAFRACAGYYILLAVLVCSVPVMRGLLSNNVRDSLEGAEQKRMQATARMASVVSLAIPLAVP